MRMISVKLLLILIVAVESTKDTSRRQTVPGLQFRFEQDFFDIAITPFILLLQSLFNQYKD